MLKRQDNALSIQFGHMNNRILLWGLLQENFGSESLTGFKDIFDNIIEAISSQSNNYANLIEMNRAFLGTAATNVNKYVQDRARRDNVGIERMRAPKDTRRVSNLNNNFIKKQDEFKGLMNDNKPSNIDFTVTEKGDFTGKLSDLMSKQLSDRSSDMMHITQTYNKKEAEKWFNNEVPPPLSIDKGGEAAVDVDVIPMQKRVSFNLQDNKVIHPSALMPRGRARSPPPPPSPKKTSFLQKLKKTIVESPTVENCKIKAMSPYKIEGGTMFFSDFDNLIKSFSVSKLFIYNSTVRTENTLKQVLENKLSDELFLLCDIGINQRMKKNGLLLFKKNNNVREVCYESTEFIEVAQNIKEMTLTFSNKNNDQLDLSPKLAVQFFIKGRSLHIKSQGQMPFYDNKFGYIVLEEGLLDVGEKILINNDVTIVIGTCLINKQEDFYHLIDTDMLSEKEHNCAIVEWNVDNRGKPPSIHRLPTLRVVVNN